jgi:hypothetical protein
MADFEVAERNAALSIWPKAVVRGCLFHFLQACERRWKAEFGANRSSAWPVVVAKLRALAACRSGALFTQLLEAMVLHLEQRPGKFCQIFPFAVD